MIKIEKGKKTHTRFFVLLAMLLVLAAMLYVLEAEISRIVLWAIILVAALQGDENEILALCMCCIPLHEFLDFHYSVVTCICVYVAKNGNRMRINFAVVTCLMMIAWEILHCFTYEFVIVDFIANFVPLIALSVLMCVDLSECDYGLIVRSMAAATMAVCTMLLVKLLYTSEFNLVYTFANLQRLGISTGSAHAADGVTINPNTLGIICVLATTGLMQLLTTGIGKKSDIVISCVLMVFGALTSSKTYLACLLMMGLLLLFAQKGSVTKKIRYLLLACLMIVVAVFVLNLIFPELLSYYIGRFSESDFTTGRFALMKNFHEWISSDLKVMFFGVGLQDFKVKVTQALFSSENVPHNMIQEIIIAWGIPGLILFCIQLLLMVSYSKRVNRRQWLMNYIPLIILLFKSQAGQMLTSPYTLLALVYAYMSMCRIFTPKTIKALQ